MLRNYLILAWKLLSRKRFYTFVSLFGISFTLMILVALTAYFDSELGAHSPISAKARIGFLPRLEMNLIQPDSVPTIDSVLVGGVMTYDTTWQVGERTTNTTISSLSYTLLDRHLRDMPLVQASTFFQSRQSFDLFFNGKKTVFQAIHADAGYWEVFDFDFLDGRPFSAAAVADRMPEAVISREASRAYFGTTEGVIGKDIELNQQRYTVVGLVADVSESKYYAHASVYLPLTFLRAGILQSTEFGGGFEAAFLTATPEDLQHLQEAMRHQARVIPLPDPENYNTLKLEVLTLEEAFADSLFNGDENAYTLLFAVFGGLMTLFMLLPTLNLINLNITRILERSSEIGVRKAFGARTQDLLFQFVFENVLLTLIGGAIGFVLALWLIDVLNDTRFLGDVTLRFSPAVYLYGLGITLLFGLLSGLLPAWRMSRLHVIHALKETAA
ncbi:MAG: ABC transporter permease [Bacteroidia bacterium]